MTVLQRLFGICVSLLEPSHSEFWAFASAAKQQEMISCTITVFKVAGLGERLPALAVVKTVILGRPEGFFNNSTI